MARTLAQMLLDVTASYLEQNVNPQALVDPRAIEFGIIDEVKTAVIAENLNREPGDKWRIPQELNFAQIALIMKHCYHVVCVRTNDASQESEHDILMIYLDEGENRGIYVSDTDVFFLIAQQYNFLITKHEFEECMKRLRSIAPRKDLTLDRDLIAVNNGVFDYRTRTLMDFSPDFVFTAKCRVDYKPNAAKPVIAMPDGVPWDVESWMEGLSDDPGVVNLLWQICGAMVRPNVRWNRSAWLYSERGNNGKGTFCELLRGLVGSGSHVAMPLGEMGKDFALEQLLHAMAIITDENDVGTYLDKAANLKALITGDILNVNRKFKTAINFRFRGFMVQCLNEMPRIRDRSDSFFRRQIFIPFEKCYTGIERKYIKEDYLRRDAVLEYVLYKVLNMDYYELDVPQSCVDALEEYKEFNDPVRQFLSEILPKTKWDMLPNEYLYDLYKLWFDANMPSGQVQGRNTFLSEVSRIVADNPEWGYSKKKMAASNRMITYRDPLAIEYKIDSTWNTTQLLDYYRGMYRIFPVAGQEDPDTAS